MEHDTCIVETRGGQDAAPRARDGWLSAFATLYARHRNCSHEDALSVARLLRPVLGVLSPSRALHTVVSDGVFLGDIADQLKRAGSRS
jgi:hypothetical protein